MSWMLWFRIGAVCGFLGVLFGAFGAHALKSILSESQLEIYKLACSYIFWHAAALLCLGALAMRLESRWVTASGVSFAFGVLLFCGSLFLLAFSVLPKGLSFITPVGGLMLIGGWLCMVAATIFT